MHSEPAELSCPTNLTALDIATRTQRPCAELPWVLFLLILGSTGCGDGTVVANGLVTVEGKPATAGRLSLAPVGGGRQVFSLVAEDGRFVLRSESNSRGVAPGSYRVTYRQPLDSQTRAQLASELAGQLSVSDMSVIYRGPADQPLNVPEAGSQELKVDVRRDQGWTRSLSD